MKGNNTKMVSVAHALSKALGSDSKKYEKAMEKRLVLESQENLPSEIKEYQKEEIRTVVNDMSSMDLEDPWANWEDNCEDNQTIKYRESKDKIDKESMLQRRRNIVYHSDDYFPVYGYAEDWEDDALNGRR